MDTLRLIATNRQPRELARLLLPSLALAAAAMLDQSTKGPSITTLLLTALLN